MEKEPEVEIWTFVPPDRRVLPATSVRRTLRTGLSGLLERLRPSYFLGEAEPFRPRDDLTPLSPHQLERISPSPDWQPAAALLGAKLDEWLETWGGVQSAALMVGPPFTGHGEILSELCRSRQWRLIEAPTPSQILTGDERWFHQFDGNTPWVLPELAHCYLRHVQGLGLARHFLSRVWSGDFGPGLIGCQSWAWQYWRHVMPNLWPSQLSPQALDHRRLGAWLRTLADSGAGRPIRFRQADTGDWVLSARTDSLPAPKGRKQSGFLKDLAAYSRGLPGVAWALWRLALRSEPETEVAVSDEAADPAEPSNEPRSEETLTVWVTAWDLVKPPSVPHEMPPDAGLILHALLLHAGLDADNLGRVTGLDQDSVMQVLHLLARAELIATGARGWEVTALGYPNIRRYLSGRGLPTDAF